MCEYTLGPLLAPAGARVAIAAGVAYVVEELSAAYSPGAGNATIDASRSKCE
jgi:hypothetical protein